MGRWRCGRSEGLLSIAALYLGATAAVQVMGFLTEYLTATIAQGVLRQAAGAALQPPADITHELL